MIKRSKQREAIRAFLMTRTDHPTAETIYLNVREQLPNVSLATVYRNLTLLADLGEIQKISTPDGPDRFDAIADPHNHFRCKSCGSVIDLLEMESVAHINELAAKCFAGKIEGHTILFHGVCPECMEG